jgi:hypothetical protein
LEGPQAAVEDVLGDLASCQALVLTEEEQDWVQFM